MTNLDTKISKEILESLTMEDLWKSPNLRKYIKKHYPRAFLQINQPFREFGLYEFIKIADEQRKNMQEMLDIGSIENFPIRDIAYAVKVIKLNKIKGDKELWIGGVPFKFELSRFVKHYAAEKTYPEWRAIMKDIGARKSNIDRILDLYKNRFKQS